MSTKRKFSEAESLETYRLTMANAETHPGIAEKLANLGYDSETLSVGKKLLEETRGMYDTSKVDKHHLAAVYKTFSEKRELLNEPYLLHKKLARVAFRKEKPIIEKLAIKPRIPSTYVKWIEAVKSFYNGAVANPDIQDKFARFNISADELNVGLAKIKEVEEARNELMKKKADSQSATKEKQETFDTTFDWMRDFYAVAKIAFTEQPQLLEAFSKVVKS